MSAFPYLSKTHSPIFTEATYFFSPTVRSQLKAWSSRHQRKATGNGAQRTETRSSLFGASLLLGVVGEAAVSTGGKALGGVTLPIPACPVPCCLFPIPC